MPQLIDTHCHLYFDDFDEDREEVYARAQEAGVEKLIHIGIDLESTQKALAYAEKYDFVYATAGVHPNDTAEVSENDIQAIEKILEHPRVVGIGEIGLDFFRDHSTQAAQEKILIRFLEIYKRIQKPLIFHCRDAFKRLAELLEESHQAPYRGLIHCFTGDQDAMQTFLDLGFHISFSGILTYKRNDELREACKACPMDRILLETDAPYLPPQSKRGKRNESAYMLEIAQVAADVHGISLNEMARTTTDNANQLFRFPR
jgi:TatD DNase family protein